MSSPVATRELTLVQALNEALHEEMELDDKIMVIGEDVAVYGGVYKVTDGLLDRFGSRRVRDTPISEAAIAGVGVGAAMIKRAGTDVTVVATSSMVGVARESAERLSQDGIDVEVVDPRTLTPLDVETIVESASRTSRCVVLDEGYTRFGATAEIAAI